MAKDLIDEEADFTADGGGGSFEDDMSEAAAEQEAYCDNDNLAAGPNGAGGEDLLPSIEELTRHMQDLADQDKEEEENHVPVQDQSKMSVVQEAVVQELSPTLETAAPCGLDSSREVLQKPSETDMEEKERLEQERIDQEIVKEVMEDKKEELESIQNLQEEINKLLAPLSNNSCNNSCSSRKSPAAPSSSCSSPFEVCESEVIIETAIIEGGDSQGKRERRISNSQEESSPSKCPRKSSSNEVTEAIEFDAITVEEVTEVQNKCANEEEEEEEDDDEEEEYDYEEEEEEQIGAKAKDKSEEKDEVALEKAKALEADRKRQEKTDMYTNDHMELRRALHRAGLDSSFISSPITTNPTLLKYASSYSTKIPDPSPEKEIPRPSDLLPKPVEKRATSSLLATEDNLSYSRYFSSSRYTSSLGPSSRITEARDQMLAMGFTDEDGWLTELITMKRLSLIHI